MISKCIERFMENKHKLEKQYRADHPAGYESIVNDVIHFTTTDDYGEFAPDPERVHVINDGDYQGTLLFIIAEKGYQPSTYYSVFVDYGSCSGCDTFEAINNYSDDAPTEQQVKDYLTLALHIAQEIKEV